MIPNGKHDQVELNYFLTCIISIGHGGGRGADIRMSLLSQGGGGGRGFRDRSAAVDES